MSLFPDSNVVYPPKVGESKTITLTGEIKRVQNVGGQNNYKDKTQKDCGYFDLIPIEDGQELKMNTWRLYFALRDAKVDVGDTIEIIHADKGEYIIQKV